MRSFLPIAFHILITVAATLLQLRNLMTLYYVSSVLWLIVTLQLGVYWVKYKQHCKSLPRLSCDGSLTNHAFLFQCVQYLNKHCASCIQNYHNLSTIQRQHTLRNTCAPKQPTNGLIIQSASHDLLSRRRIESCIQNVSYVMSVRAMTSPGSPADLES